MKPSRFFLVFAAAVVLAAGCSNKGPTSLSVTPSNLSLTEGESSVLTATVLPEGSKYGTINWKSSDEGVAMVGSTGKVMAISAGSATITATTEGVSGTAKVTVKAKEKEEKPVAVESVLVEPATLSITEGKTYQLKATVKPENATNKKLVWTCSDYNVVMIDENGLVSALKVGKARVKATSKENADIMSACEITVEADNSLKGITLSPEEMDMSVGETKTLAVVYNPTYAENKNVTWATSNASVVTVDNGKVKAVGAGTATITATSEEGGFKATCQVTVTKEETGTKVYYLENNHFYVDGTKKEEWANNYVNGGYDIYNKDVYWLDNSKKDKSCLVLFKNGTELEQDNLIPKNHGSSPYEFSNLKIGGGKAFCVKWSNVEQEAKLITVDVKTGATTEKDFLTSKLSTHNGISFVHVTASPSGTAYISALVNDEFNEYACRMWTVTPDGKSEEKVLVWKQRTPYCIEISESGDVYVFVRMDYGEASIFKNGEEFKHFDNYKQNITGLAVMNNDVYCAFVNMKNEVEIRKNDELLYSIPGGIGIRDSGMAVSKKGDVYTIVQEPEGDKVYKNDKLLYTGKYLSNIELLE